MSKYDTKTIRDAIDGVAKAEWILPTFQRKYVWDQDQICDLFDSIMRSYPISTFMIWKVSKDTASKNKFYKFLKDYQEWWKEIGEEAPTNTLDQYYSVIDGQQRINSLYIGYCGSYAVKLKNKRFKKAYDESIQPKTYLYLNLLEDAPEETSRLYDFRFFSDDALKENPNKKNWFKVGDILKLDIVQRDDLDFKLPSMVEKQGFLNGFSAEERSAALKRLNMLYVKTFYTDVINYYQENEQDLDRVVDVFLRANGGGTPLEFSDLVMAVLTQQWAEAKNKIEGQLKLIYAETGIALNKDFVLKVFLTLFSKDISFKVKNFEGSNSNLINLAMANFDKISQIITGTCKFANQIGLSNDTLRSKYALIPIIYFSYTKKININSNTKYVKANKKLMDIWIKSALLKGMFGGKPDSVLTKIKKIIEGKKYFPTKEIIDAFKNESKDISIDRNFVEDRVNKSHYGTTDAYLLLSLATSLDPQKHYNVDHMYPKDMFKKTELDKLQFLANDKTLREFYENKENWDTVGNLQLLNDSENKSKNDEELAVWLKGKGNLGNYFIPYDNNDTPIVEKEQFKDFVTKRRTLIVDAIMETLNLEDKN